MRTIEAAFQTGLAFSRSQLSRIANKDDRTVRENIRLLRRAGVPIVALKDGGYKLAETPEEKAQLAEHVPYPSAGRAYNIQQAFEGDAVRRTDYR